MFYSYLNDWYQQMDPHEGKVCILLFNEREGTFHHSLFFGGTFFCGRKGTDVRSCTEAEASLLRFLLYLPPGGASGSHTAPDSFIILL